MTGPYDGQRVTYTFGAAHGETRSVDITSMSLRGAIAGFRAGTLHPERLADKDGLVPVRAPTRAAAYAPVVWVEVARIPPEILGEDDPMALLRGMPIPQEVATAGTGITVLGEAGALARSSRTELRDQDRALVEQLEQLEALRRELVAKRAALEAEITKRKEQVWLIELFLGSSETVQRLRDGAPAGATVPITVRQQVLCMDEEIAVHDGLQDPERAGTFDVLRLADFDAWVCQPEALAQVCPWEKGVVGLRVRRRERERENPHRDFAVAMENAEMAETDRLTFLLVRNGEQLYRISLDVNLWPRLFPSESDVRPNPHAWGSERGVDQARLKSQVGGLLALQGILERSELLHPLPRRISVFDPVDADAFQLVRDGEEHVALASSPDDPVHLSWGSLYAKDANGYSSHLVKEGYRRWLLAQVKPGMRVMWLAKVRAYDGRNRDDWFGSLEHRTGIKRISSTPTFGGVYTLDPEAVRGTFSYSFSYLPTDPVFTPDPMYRGCYIEHPRTRRVRFCCFTDEVYPVDLISWRVLEGLIRSREQRANNEDMLRIAFRFWRFAKQEAARERPFIDLVLRQAGLDPQDPGIEDERARAERLLRWWKVKTRENRSLGTDEPKALRMILAAFKRGEDADNDPERAFLRAWRVRG